MRHHGVLQKEKARHSGSPINRYVSVSVFYSMAKVQMHESGVCIEFPPFSAFPFICFGEIVLQ